MSHSKKSDSGIIEIESKHNYHHAIQWLEQWGHKLYGSHFKINEEDKPLIYGLISYFLKDEPVASKLCIDLNKGILLTGPVGCGKTSILTLMRYFEKAEHRFIIKPCREVSFEFIKDGYETIHKYSRSSFKKHEPQAYCFDDLGTENTLKYYGNECNVMAEILLSRYDLFVSRQLITHLTSNLSAGEIESAYGNRVRSRMREMFNLVAFGEEVKDKRA
ncbi:ATPase [soil metagenome]